MTPPKRTRPGRRGGRKPAPPIKPEPTDTSTATVDEEQS